MKTFIGLNAFQIYAIISAGLTLLILVEAFIGHYKSGFNRLVQYVPFISGGLLIVTIIAVLLFPSFLEANSILIWIGWLSIVTGIIGFGFHHYFGMVKKPGGYKWFLHNLI